MMVPQIDCDIGMSTYSTDSEGIGGIIRKNTSDFVVNETLFPAILDKITDNPGYAVYILKKQNIDTNHAINHIYKKTRTRLKALGLKDAKANTEQYVCAMTKSEPIEFSSDKISLSHVGFVQKPLSKKDMSGNRFTIKVSDNTKDIPESINLQNILNYFGYQRFGSKRPVSHLIGKALVRQDWGEAIALLLSFTSKYDTAEHQEQRHKLADLSDIPKLLREIPPQMDLERTVLSKLADGADSKLALRALPLSMRRFFVNAYQSYLFNLTLSALWGVKELVPKEGDVCYDDAAKLGKYKGDNQKLAVPLVGYSYYKKTRFHDVISEILQSEDITPSDFFIKEMQEASSEGGFRHATIQCTDYIIKPDTIQFMLSRGSFATIIMREIIKPQEPLECGF